MKVSTVADGEPSLRRADEVLPTTKERVGVGKA